MSRSGKKANRLLQIEALLLAHPEGLTQADIARKLQVNRSTVGRYFVDLPGHIYLDDLDGNKWKVDREGYLVNVRFNLHEALAIHLATRLLATRMDRQNPHAAAALRKLGVSLERLAARISAHIKQSADVMDDAARRHDPLYMQVLEKLTRAWAEGRKVEVWHRYEPTGSVHKYKFAPYFVEPYAIGQTTHVIGWREPPGAMRTFKIERIERIELLAEPYTVPADFNPRQFLTDAWGIWYTEEEPQEVVLRFSRSVANRVRESRWHESEQLVEEADGRLLWQAQVAEPQEMLPWIRGWGADVEVLGPDHLRETVKSHVRHAANQYEIMTQATDLTTRLLRLWGKTSKYTELFHPALYHMFDVAHVAQQLLSSRATPRWRNVLARALDADTNTLHEWLPWFIALHDIGKISVPFQAQNTAQRARLEAEKFEFGRYSSDHKKLHHTLMGQMALKEWAKTYPYAWRTVFLDMVSGHHGVYQQAERTHNQLWETLHEPEEWQRLRQQAITVLQNCLLLNEPVEWPKPENISAAIVALNGFTILCDWLGSDEQYFMPKPDAPILEYLSISRQKAKERVESAGFFVPAISVAPATFTGLFGWQPRPLQQAIDDIPDHLLTEPTLTIIEAPTGEGKTEAALTLAHRIAQVQGTDELYVALPTTATSNAMFKRLQEHLQERLLLPPDLVQLVHGQAFLMKDDLRITPLVNGDGDPHPALTWFEPKKKSLLAPFGVGTVDQAELAALNVRHNALRLIGLAGKVVILDEVHAYDTYMTTIIRRMLQWLAALGSSVVLLSATLPTAKRRQLAEAYTGGNVALEETQAYPYLLTVNGTAFHSASPPAEDESKIIYLSTLHFAEEDWRGKAAWLLQQTESGGCVCWITNTVERAQRTFEALLNIAPHDVDCLLLHARFPLADRQVIEEEILAKYGKGATDRPPKGIVIGTQVLEQSLDIDFDLMVTDLAPIDLLLQRVGRLHRHNRSNRADAHPEPHVYVNYELDEAQQLRIGADRFYTPFILLKTWQVIEQKKTASGYFNLPDNYRPLIEAVYDETPPEAAAPFFKEWEKRQRKETILADEAAIRLAKEPDPRRSFWKHDGITFHEDEESAAWMVAQTRYQERETITVIPMEKIGEDNGRYPHTTQSIALTQPANRQVQLDLLQRSVRISRPEIVKVLKAVEKPALFTESALLKRCYPLWLENDSVQIEDLVVRLEPRLGILIQKKGA